MFIYFCVCCHQSEWNRQSIPNSTTKRGCVITVYFTNAYVSVSAENFPEMVWIVPISSVRYRFGDVSSLFCHYEIFDSSISTPASSGASATSSRLDTIDKFLYAQKIPPIFLLWDTSFDSAQADISEGDVISIDEHAYPTHYQSVSQAEAPQFLKSEYSIHNEPSIGETETADSLSKGCTV
jgi:hypothetical protein